MKYEIPKLLSLSIEARIGWCSTGSGATSSGTFTICMSGSTNPSGYCDSGTSPGTGGLPDGCLTTGTINSEDRAGACTTGIVNNGSDCAIGNGPVV
ncbi:MAG: hypothetical protein ABH842_02155 [Candidatus Micrarchaeota archaeon]